MKIGVNCNYNPSLEKKIFKKCSPEYFSPFPIRSEDGDRSRFQNVAGSVQF